MGASATNYKEIVQWSSQVVALKMYLNETFTTLKLDGIQTWLKVSSHSLSIAEILDSTTYEFFVILAFRELAERSSDLRPRRRAHDGCHHFIGVAQQPLSPHLSRSHSR